MFAIASDPSLAHGSSDFLLETLERKGATMTTASGSALGGGSDLGFRGARTPAPREASALNRRSTAAAASQRSWKDGVAA
ncbi:hypothetical protein [Methylosinus sp. Ce-a6]|uniref:hypothetical protein n=1 Tax=Methylosinus sp. Ce-a6 TaxID=2172005 RepID=UPI001359F69E|nr:hypothetical protein [Methylosinus sp. Ce-a6]